MTAQVSHAIEYSSGTSAPTRARLAHSRAREWEMTRYRACQAQLAGQPVGETFSRTAAFLRLAADGTSLTHA